MPSRRLFYSTDELVRKFKPSLTSTFDVFISKSFSGIDDEVVNFSAYEAVLPGSSFELGQVFGDRQGVTEQYATKRVYPPVDVSFYVDVEYGVLDFFERWFKQINDKSDDFRFSYPSGGYKTNVIITKFEREFRESKDRLNSPGTAGTVSEPSYQARYNLRNAFPSNIISVPVSYGQSDVLRTTITFNYDYYDFEVKKNKKSFNEGI
jgi:hypothetical protein